MIKKAYISILFLLFTVCVFGQKAVLRDAKVAYHQDSLMKAKLLIDQAALHEETKNDPVMLYYKGFVYKDIYKKQEKENFNSPARVIAIKAFTELLSMDSIGKIKPSSVNSLKNLNTSVHNDLAQSINNGDYQSAVKLYDRYHSTMVFLEPEHDFTAFDIRYYLALGSVYNDIYNSDKEERKEFMNKAVDCYHYVLKLDSTSHMANYNMGILYYNEAVDIIKNLDYDVDLITLELIQDEVVQMFQQALPFMQRAYELNPTRKETLHGLSGIYFSLNELEKSEEFQKRLKTLDQKKE